MPIGSVARGISDPQEVADALKKLVDMPAGTRPLPTVMSFRIAAGPEVKTQPLFYPANILYRG